MDEESIKTIKEIIGKYSDEKLEEYTQEWLTYDFEGNSWETVKEYQCRKEAMLAILLHEKLKRAEEEYA